MKAADVSQSRDLKTRFQRLGFIMVMIYVGYISLEYLLGMQMYLINYLLYPFVLLIFILDKFQSNPAAYLQKNKLSARATSYLLFKYTVVLSIIALMIPVLTGMFLSATVSQGIAVDLNWSKNTFYYLTHLWLIIPLPAIVVYMCLYDILIKKGLNNLYEVVNQLVPLKIRNDTIHHVLLIFHALSTLGLILLMSVLGIYACYLWVCSLLLIPAFKGASIASLLFCCCSIVILFRPAMKKTLRKSGHNSWSMGYFFLIFAGLAIFWMLIPSLLYKLLYGSLDWTSSIWFESNYNYLPNQLENFFCYLIKTIWFLSFPILAIYFTRQGKTSNLNIYSNVILIVIAYMLVIFFGEIVNVFLQTQSSEIIKLVNLNHADYLLVINLSIILLFYYLFNNRFDKNCLVTEDILILANTKFRAVNRSYYFLILIISMLLFLMVLENLFLIQKILAYISGASTLFFLVLFFQIIKLPVTAKSV